MRPRAVSPAVEAVPRDVLFRAFPVRGRTRAATLIVDADDAVRTELATYICRQGCAVKTATDLPTALDAFARAEFDVVFADVRVAGDDGTLLAQMRQIRPGTAPALREAH